MDERSKWKAWRIYCPDWETVAKALAYFAGPLLKWMEEEGLIDSWYVSRKSDVLHVEVGVSFRMYVRFPIDIEEQVENGIENAYNSNKDRFGFKYKEYVKDLPEREDSMDKLNQASKLAIVLLRESKGLPADKQSVNEILEELRRNGHLNGQSQHFVMNVLGLPG